MDVNAQLDRIFPDLLGVIARTKVDQLDDPTPCKDFRVRDLLNHLIGGAGAFAPQLRGDPEPGAVDPATVTDEDRAAAAARGVNDLRAACSAAGAAERSVDLPFGTVPGEVLIRFLTVDGMVHTWDLATATGQPYDPPAPLAEAVLVTAQHLIAPGMRDGDTFAEPRPVAADAPALTRLVAFTGRTI